MKSDTQEIQAIVERLNNLETQNRRLKRGGIAVLVAFSAVIAMAQSAPAPKVIEAQKFVLKDADGIVRGWFGVYAGGTELTLGNVKKQPQMRLLVSEDGSDLHFFGSHNGGMTLSVNSGEPTIALAGADGSGGAGIAFSDAGPAFTLSDRDGSSAVIGATQVKARVGSDAPSTSAASVVLLGKGKNVIWQAP